MRRCTESGCTYGAVARGLCGIHYNRRRRAGTLPPLAPRPERPRPARPNIAAGVPVGDELLVVCPNPLVPLVAAAVDLDAKAIVRAIWPHLLEASFAGVEPFTLKALP
jgi:hypothetical protein